MESASPAPSIGASVNAVHNAITYLRQAAEAFQSFDHLSRLAGFQIQQLLVDAANADKTSQLAIEYLLAVVRHLPAARLVGNSSGMNDVGNLSAVITKDILQGVSSCVKKVDPRQSIAETGILSALHALCDNERLMPEHCEFLQACVVAQEYQLAESQILNTWPRPQKGSPSTTVETVLRYFYLRGVVHLNCGASSYALAIRCFWTCLTVPATSDKNVVSAIAISAWKKLILVQALHFTEYMSDASVLVGSNNGSNTAAQNSPLPNGFHSLTTGSSSSNSFDPLSTPKEMSAGMSRFLSSAKAPPSQESQTMNEDPSASPITSHVPRPFAEADRPEVVHFVEVEGDENSGTGNDSERYSSSGVYIYKELLRAFVDTDRVSFDAMVVEHGSFFRGDGNLSLVRSVGAALRHRQLYELSHVYSVVSLSQLSNDLGLSIPDIQSVLERLRSDKGWAVELRPDGVVVFPQVPPPWPQPTDAKEVIDELAQLSQLIRLINGTLQKPRGSKDMTSFKSDLSGPCGVADF